MLLLHAVLFQSNVFLPAPLRRADISIIADHVSESGL